MSRKLLPAIVSLVLGSAVACGGGNSASPSENIPNYGGSWSGTYTITGCTQSGGVGLANICGAIGVTAPYAFTLNQSGRSVTGSFTLGSIPFPSTGGTIGTDGSLALSATSQNNGITIIANWALTLPSTALAGTITQVWTSTTLSGQANVAGVIGTAVHAAAASRPGLVVPESLEEAVRAIAR